MGAFGRGAVTWEHSLLPAKTKTPDPFSIRGLGDLQLLGQFTDRSSSNEPSKYEGDACDLTIALGFAPHSMCRGKPLLPEGIFDHRGPASDPVSGHHARG